MSSYNTIITNNGKALFANAATSTQKVNITHLAVGDGGGIATTPKQDQSKLVAERHRVAVISVERHPTNTNWIEVNAVIPSSSGGYTVREIGLYAGSTLVAIGSFPATYKPTQNEGGAREMSIRVVIAMENASVVTITLDNSLVYATRKWTQDNFVNHNEVIDNLTSTETTKPLSAHQGKILNDKITVADGYIHAKADKTTTITAGAGLLGGGTLHGNRTLSLGTPSKITANSGNTLLLASHTHEIDKASTTTAGIVQLNSTLRSTSQTEALTANAGRVLYETKLGKTENAASATKLQTARTINGVAFDGTQNITITDNTKAPAVHRHNWSEIDGKPSTFTPTSHTHTWSQITGVPSASTTAQGIVQLNDTLTSTATNQALTANQGKILNDKITVSDGYIHAKADKTTSITAGAGLLGGGTLHGNRTLSLGTPSKITATSINTAVSNTHSHEIDKASTTTQGIVQLNDSLTSTATNQALTANQGKVLNDSKLGNSGTQTLRDGMLTINNNWWGKIDLPLTDGSGWKIEANPNYKSAQNGGLAIRFMHDNAGTKTFYDLHKSDKSEVIAYQSWVQNANVATATKLQTARTISLTGAVTGSVAFDGSRNVSISTTLTKAVVRDYNRTINATAVGQTNNTITVAGQTVVSPDGRITQYFHLKHFRDIWFGLEDAGVGYGGERGFKIPVALWTAMPNKVLSVQAHTMRSTDASFSVTYKGEAVEHNVAWDMRSQGTDKSNVALSMARFTGGSSEHMDLFVIVEGY